MEISAGLIYLIEMLKPLKVLCIMALFLGVWAFIYATLAGTFDFVPMGGEEGRRKEEKLTRSFKHWGLTAIIVSTLVYVFVPSRSTAIAMVAIPAVVNNEKLQNVSQELLNYVQYYLHELKKEKKED